MIFGKEIESNSSIVHDVHEWLMHIYVGIQQEFKKNGSGFVFW